VSLAKLLVIEDDPSLNNQLTSLLRQRDFEVEQQFDGEKGLLTAMQKKFDLILLDVLLPKRDGFSILNALRKNDSTPIIMLTACGAEEERIKGLSRGADDYLPKPFNMEELLLRIEAILRRCGAMLSSYQAQFKIQTEGLMLNRREQTTHFMEKAVQLTPIQFKLLWVLASHKDEILNKPFLYQLVLEREFSAYDRSLDMHVSRVRKKLVSVGMPQERIRTVHGGGYCFS
jgi:two-component system response regulator PfeR